MNDGCVFFGTNPQLKKEGGLFGAFQKKEIINDVTLGETAISVEPQQTNVAKRNFFIRYKMDTKGYYLKDTGEGSGTFVRVDRPLVISFKLTVALDSKQWLSHLIRRVPPGCIDPQGKTRI